MPKFNHSLTVSESEEWIFNPLILIRWITVEMKQIDNIVLLEIRALSIIRGVRHYHISSGVRHYMLRYVGR